MWWETQKKVGKIYAIPCKDHKGARTKVTEQMVPNERSKRCSLLRSNSTIKFNLWSVVCSTNIVSMYMKPNKWQQVFFSLEKCMGNEKL